ncbi:nitroreductase [Bacillus mesophilus]|uniref:Putative NAD(P)H nitroreductase n=1 Tax=Bacillus mesophilus TaxID=1808955 RepID=A0A6M0Q2Y5_9BACI|nr:nitroreductase [Bacillus mesophilus]MBM7659886.1 nitroreductase [Bacillus mesophilus]NEY70745.1 nitroreductase [Bacillus mesophilus]
MEFLEIIRSRRSSGLVTDEPVSKEMLEKVLEAGTWAPNHHKTEPWKYFVLTGDSRNRLGEVLAKISEQNMEDPSSESNQKKIMKAKENSLRAPVIIVAAVEPSNHEKVIVQEEFGAVYASIQNMLLAAHALGLGGIWRTGQSSYDPLMRELFGLSEQGEVLGFLYLGHPRREVPAGKRKSIEEVTRWLTKESDFENL